MPIISTPSSPMTRSSAGISRPRALGGAAHQQATLVNDFVRDIEQIDKNATWSLVGDLNDLRLRCDHVDHYRVSCAR